MDEASAGTKSLLNDRFNTIQSQLDDFKKTQNK
jgi:hypothetical protein